MKTIQDAIYLSGAHIYFKKVKNDEVEIRPRKLSEWKIPKAPGRKPSKNQAIIGGIARDPVNKQAALLISKIK